MMMSNGRLYHHGAENSHLCQQRYSTTDREWLAAVECITRVWRHWLLGKEFLLCTDHAALKEILTKKGEDFTHRQLR